jgi:hypothetical protein
MGLSFLSRKKDRGHELVQERLSEYLDGRLPADQRADVEHHLEECRECSRELQALRATRQMLRSLPPVPLPRSFTLEAAPRPAPLPRGFFWLRSATAVTAAAFVLLLVAPVVLPKETTPVLRPAVGQTMGTPGQSTAADGRAALVAQPTGAPSERPSASAGQPATAGQAPAASAAPRAAAPLAQPAAPAAAAASAPAPTAPAGGQPSAPDQVEGKPQPQPNPAIEPHPVEVAQPSGLWLPQLIVGGLALLLGLGTWATWWRHRPS